MKTIVAMLALAMALTNVAIGAGTGMPMMKGLKDPTALANLVDSALKRDPTGNSLLDSARCKKDGSCATAHDYFYGIQKEHPSAKMGDIAELPRYLRSLMKQSAPTGEWYMSRLLVKGEKRTYDHMAWHRAFFKGEDVWDDPNTGEHILAGFCENVVGKLKSPIAEKETPIKVRDVTPPVPSVTVPPKAPTLTQYALQINCMSDRADGFWRSKYDTAKAKRAENLTRTDINKKGMLPYYEVFTLAPFGEMLAERKSRPLDCRFLVRFLKKEPVLNIQPEDSATERAQKYSEYLKQFQYPLEDNVLTGGWVSTGRRGWVIVPVFAFDDFEAVLVQPEQIGDVLEPVIVVHRPEFEKLSNPVHIWEVKQ